ESRVVGVGGSGGPGGWCVAPCRAPCQTHARGGEAGRGAMGRPATRQSPRVELVRTRCCPDGFSLGRAVLIVLHRLQDRSRLTRPLGAREAKSTTYFRFGAPTVKSRLSRSGRVSSPQARSP